MNDRQSELLNYIVEDYIATAQPVGSSYLVSKYRLDFSDATVRNECQILEKEGYLTHPHTSAGRMPTEKGYKEYLESKINSRQTVGKKSMAVKKDSQVLEKVYSQARGFNRREATKVLVKSLAGLSQTAVLVAFSRNDVFYTGLSYLFSQPEFKNLDLVYNIGTVVDQLDEIFPEVYSDLTEEITVKIGSRNPFSSDCAFIGARFGPTVMGMLGPMRMDYLGNIERLGCIKELLGE